ncbi:hypothetical protein VTK73DRAFT_7132 [Phialemonium thermophilum]|uniref:6-pyruvoyltetrahydropterin synthase n=1 Tax=Phialemonium thermophilum TaxID=223376 RepID=A0ABR3WGF5_9PEZI
MRMSVLPLAAGTGCKHAVTMAPTYRMVLEKKDFHFSASHFTILTADHAEPLHGHNYHVRVELYGHALDRNDLLLDITAFKSSVRDLCSRLDHRVLIQSKSPHLRVTRSPGIVEVRFCSETYQYPESSILFLPLVNTSMEALSAFIWTELSAALVGTGVESVKLIIPIKVLDTLGRSSGAKSHRLALGLGVGEYRGVSRRADNVFSSPAANGRRASLNAR